MKTWRSIVAVLALALCSCDAAPDPVRECVLIESRSPVDQELLLRSPSLLIPLDSLFVLHPAPVAPEFSVSTSDSGVTVPLLELPDRLWLTPVQPGNALVTVAADSYCGPALQTEIRVSVAVPEAPEAPDPAPEEFTGDFAVESVVPSRASVGRWPDNAPPEETARSPQLPTLVHMEWDDGLRVVILEEARINLRPDWRFEASFDLALYGDSTASGRETVAGPWRLEGSSIVMALPYPYNQVMKAEVDDGVLQVHGEWPVRVGVVFDYDFWMQTWSGERVIEAFWLDRLRGLRRNGG